jgi:hypothetical protein
MLYCYICDVDKVTSGLAKKRKGNWHHLPQGLATRAEFPKVAFPVLGKKLCVNKRLQADIRSPANECLLKAARVYLDTEKLL